MYQPEIQPRISPKFPPYLALVLGVIFISTSAILVRWSQAPAAVIAFYRLLFTLLMMAPFWAVAKKWDVSGITRREWLLMGLSGVMLAFHFIFWFISLEMTSVASSVVLVTLSPLFTFVGARIFFQEKAPAKALLGGAMAMGGGMIIGWGDFAYGMQAVIGDLLALLAALLVAVYWMIGQFMRKVTDSFTYTSIVYGMSALTLFIYMLLSGESFAPYPAMEWLLFIALAIFPTLLGHSVFNWSLKWVSASAVSVSVLGEAAGASILACFLLGEAITLQQGLGGIILLIGIFIFNRYQHR